MHTFCKWAGFVSDAPGEDKDLYTNILQFHYTLPDGTWPRIHTLPGHRAPRVPPGQPVRGGDHGQE